MIMFRTDFFLQSKWKIAYNSKSTDFFFFVNIICHNAVLMDEWVNLRGNVLFLFLFFVFFKGESLKNTPNTNFIYWDTINLDFLILSI